MVDEYRLKEFDIGETIEWIKASEMSSQVIMFTLLQDFHQCGIHLDAGSRQQVVQLTDRILRTGQQFAAGCHEPRVVGAHVLPARIRTHFPTDGDRVVISGKWPFLSFGPEKSGFFTSGLHDQNPPSTSKETNISFS